MPSLLLDPHRRRGIDTHTGGPLGPPRRACPCRFSLPTPPTCICRRSYGSVPRSVLHAMAFRSCKPCSSRVGGCVHPGDARETEPSVRAAGQSHGPQREIPRRTASRFNGHRERPGLLGCWRTGGGHSWRAAVWRPWLKRPHMHKDHAYTLRGHGSKQLGRQPFLPQKYDESNFIHVDSTRARFSVPSRQIMARRCRRHDVFLPAMAVAGTGGGRAGTHPHTHTVCLYPCSFCRPLLSQKIGLLSPGLPSSGRALLSAAHAPDAEQLASTPRSGHPTNSS